MLVFVILVAATGKLTASNFVVVDPIQVCLSKINSPPQASPSLPSFLPWCLRFHAIAPDPPRFEVDLRSAPSDSPSGWADLLPGAGPHLLPNLVLLIASTTSMQPHIHLTSAHTKKLCT
jgi:hypothetical protein